MSDLISRSELLKRFCINKDGHRIPERDCDNFEVTVSVKDIKTIIKEQPTAYNVDKVVEELELHSFEFGTDTLPVHYVRLNDAIEIVKQEAEQYNNGWVPCSVELPPQPVENPIFDNKPLELYLVSVKNADYPIRAFWNGKFFTDGWSKVDVIAWQPLQKPYHPKGE